MGANIVIDVQGLSCPQPVLQVSKELKKLATGIVEVLADSEIACENIARMATHAGWKVEVTQQNKDTFKILIQK